MPPEAAAAEPSAADLAPTAPPEGIPEPQEPAEPSDADKYEGKLANMTAQSKGLQLELQKHMAASKSASEELATLKEQLAADEKELTEDTLGYLKRKGRGYGELTAELLKGDEAPLTPEQEQIKELLAFKTAAEERETAAAEERETAAQTQAREGNLTAIRQALAEEDVEDVDARTGEFAYLSVLGQEEAILGRLLQHREQWGADPDPAQQAEICQKAEAGVREQTHANVDALLKGDKSGTFREYLVKALAASGDNEPIDGQATTRRKGRGNGAPTLTQRSRSAASPPPTDADGKRVRLSDEEKMANAEARLKALFGD